MAGVKGYRLINVRLVGKTMVSPSLLSLVFTAPEVAKIKNYFPDQRIKIVLPSIEGPLLDLAFEADWYQTVQSLPKEKRPFIRTYTLCHVDPLRQEITVEFVIHGTEGPASAWAIQASPGEVIQMVAPDGDFQGNCGGYEWNPPDNLQNALIIADETALPAAKNIVEQLAKQANPPRVQAFIEVPLREDCVDLCCSGFVEVIWLPRSLMGEKQGEGLIKAVKTSARLPDSNEFDAIENESEDQLLWEKATSRDREFYGWVAAESSVVKLLRRYLIGERGVSNESINFMAYWAKGRVR